MDLSRRGLLEKGLIAALSPFAAYQVEKKYELTDDVERQIGLESDYQYAVEEMKELDEEVGRVASGDTGLIDSLETVGMYLGNPNHYPGYGREGIIHPEGLEEYTAEQSLRRYAEDYPGESPFSPTEIGLFLDDRLDINLIYPEEGGGHRELVDEGAEVVETAVDEVLPQGYDLEVGTRVDRDPVGEVSAILDDIGDNPVRKIRALNDRYLAFDQREPSGLSARR